MEADKNGRYAQTDRDVDVVDKARQRTHNFVGSGLFCRLAFDFHDLRCLAPLITAQTTKCPLLSAPSR